MKAEKIYRGRTLEIEKRKTYQCLKGKVRREDQEGLAGSRNLSAAAEVERGGGRAGNGAEKALRTGSWGRAAESSFLLSATVIAALLLFEKFKKRCSLRLFTLLMGLHFVQNDKREDWATMGFGLYMDYTMKRRCPQKNPSPPAPATEGWGQTHCCSSSL